MPVYDYECMGCGAHFEVRHGFHEEPVVLCPHCQGSARRVLHPVPTIFKGTGFYVTDNRRGNNSGNSEKPQKQESPDPATAKED